MSHSSDSLEGSWSPKRSTGDGEPTPVEDLRDVTLIYENGMCEVWRGETLIRRGTYSTDAAQTPKTLDVCFTESDVPELINSPLCGIYERTGDHLRICFGPPSGHRARSFSAEKGTGQYLGEYRRIVV